MTLQQQQYYYRNRDHILAMAKIRYQIKSRARGNKVVRVVKVSKPIIDSTYVTSKMEKLIEQFGEKDARWYNDIRIGIGKGISTSTLSEQDQEKWWKFFAIRTREAGMDDFERAEHAKEYYKTRVCSDESKEKNRQYQLDYARRRRREYAQILASEQSNEV